MTKKLEVVKSNISINDSVNGKYNIFCPISNNHIIEEQFKSIDVSGEKDLLNKILSKNLTDNSSGITIEPHPFDYKLIEDLLKKFGLANAVVQKYCDNVIGKGIYIESEDEDLVKDMEKWMRDSVFKPNLKGTFKEGLSKGSGFMEIAGFLNPGLMHSTKTVNSNTMYIQKDKYGTILKFVQFIGEDIARAKKEDLIEFDPAEMLHITINKIGSNLYGYGIIYSTLPTTNNFLLVQDSMHKLIKRKANNPIHVKMGNVEKNDWPTQNDIEGFGKNLTFMNESTEWVTGPNIEMNVLNFGPLGEKFQSILDNDYKLLSYSYQVPETILGAGNIAEGLAGEQKESFLKTCQALQEELEIALRTQIFDILAERFGKKDIEYKICFDTMTDSERNRRIIALKDLVGANVSPGLKKEIERRISYLLDIDFEVVDEENERINNPVSTINPDGSTNDLNKSEQPEKDKLTSDNSEQDKLSGDKTEKDRLETSIIEIKEKINDYPLSMLLKAVNDNSKGIYKNISHYITDKTDETLQTDVTIKEWVKTDYAGYKDAIIQHIKEDNFDDLRASGKTELKAGYLSTAQIEKLREVFIEGFKDNNGIKGISEKIKSNVDIGNLYEHTSRKLVKDEDGNNIILLDKNVRSDMIARTEIVRLTAEGAMIKMKTQGIETCKWVVAETERTCPECLALDGQIFEVANLDNSPPLHPNCACHVESVETQQEHFAKIRNILEEGKKLKLSPQEIELKLSEVLDIPYETLQKFTDSVSHMENKFKTKEGWVTTYNDRHIYIDDQGNAHSGEDAKFYGDRDKSWKPTMSQEEADKWAKDSTVNETIYHGTSAKNAQSIKDNGFKEGYEGRGIYLSDDKEEASFYLDVRPEKGELLKTKVNVKNMKEVSREDKIKILSYKSNWEKIKGESPDGFFYNVNMKTGSFKHYVIFNPKAITVIK